MRADNRNIWDQIDSQMENFNEMSTTELEDDRFKDEIF